ncbi:MAG: hypothetical protein QM479_17325 [Pseudomonadota bacterium]
MTNDNQDLKNSDKVVNQMVDILPVPFLPPSFLCGVIKSKLCFTN